MSQAQAARTSLAELRHLIAAKNREVQERWEIARWVCWHQHLLSPNIKPYDKKSTAKAFFPFPWDEPEKEITAQDCYITDDQLKALRGIFAKLDNKVQS